ncbi:MAG: hypothetical protein Q4D21_00250 [Phascolarctobacterium sp.]|nr:hypothetical protein [Phascolarctobacterium sp.]
MKGNSLPEFIDDLLTAGGPEKEFIFHDKRYFLETIWHEDLQENEMYIFEITDNDKIVFSCFGKNLEECVRQFEKAPIFDGLNIYQVEQEISVLFG